MVAGPARRLPGGGDEPVRDVILEWVAKRRQEKQVLRTLKPVRIGATVGKLQRDPRLDTEAGGEEDGRKNLVF
jgi:hypothetical protein